VALDVSHAEEALALVDRLPRADFFKVGLQLYTAAGPGLVRSLKDRGLDVFLDLKLHDIPNTVAGAVRSAADLGVDLLTIHVSGGLAMLRSAAAVADSARHRVQLFGVTVLTSLGPEELAHAWGRPVVDVAAEGARLAQLADRSGMTGVVCSLHEVHAIRAATRSDFPVLTPGIRRPGDLAGDQARIGTPRDALTLGVDYLVLGRTVTAAPDPAAAFDEVLTALGVSVSGHP
jgi:orotidine-5'-phosphate decarboxylase